PAAIAALHDLRKRGDKASLLSALHFLGFSGERDRIERITKINIGPVSGVSVHIRTMLASLSGEARKHAIQDYVNTRNFKRQAKEFAEEDAIRDGLADNGIFLKDSRDPKTGEITTTWEIAR